MTQREAFEAFCLHAFDPGQQHSIHDTGYMFWQAATMAERERCAKVCDFMAKLGAEDRMPGAVVIATELAATIRKG